MAECLRQATWLKSVAVVVSISGVVMMSLAPQVSEDGHATPVGYLWLMVSVLCYASYEVCTCV
jgi:drug/metabolite transporter (DMT)-like permease